jgi:DNA-binding NarL/FixJ family response regulator
MKKALLKKALLKKIESLVDEIVEDAVKTALATQASEFEKKQAKLAEAAREISLLYKTNVPVKRTRTPYDEVELAKLLANGNTVKEIAEILGRPIGEVRTKIHRMRKAM